MEYGSITVSNRETVGGIERATSQSSHITEWYFYQHEQTKLEALNVFIEAAKTALKDNPKKLKYILDRKILEILDVTEDDLADVDIGVAVTNSKKSQEYKQMLQQSAQAFMQNGGEFSFIFDILNSNSMAEKRRMIEEYENDKREQASEAQAAESKNIESQLQAEAVEKEKDRAVTKYVADKQAEVDLRLGEMKALIDSGKLKIDSSTSLESMKLEIMRLQEEIEQNDAENKLSSRDLDIKEKAAKNKPAAVTN